jgi:phosphoadenosine phosphosulfate reductase
MSENELGTDAPPSPEALARTNRMLASLALPQVLAWAVTSFPGQAVLANSLGAEDQVLLDVAARHGLLAGELPLEVFTIDSGRLFPETLALLAENEARYAVRFRVYYPDRVELERLVHEHGIDCFRRSVELRQRCCHVRKVMPLRRALAGKRLWIAGLRHEQNANRATLEPLTWDTANDLLKLCPLLDWTAERILAYLDAHQVPRNPLHAQGYPSIGCAPCTRAVAPGEDPRAGRWWWEQDSPRECGLHLANGRLVRTHRGNP